MQTKNFIRKDFNSSIDDIRTTCWDHVNVLRHRIFFLKN